MDEIQKNIKDKIQKRKNSLRDGYIFEVITKPISGLKSYQISDATKFLNRLKVSKNIEVFLENNKPPSLFSIRSNELSKAKGRDFIYVPGFTFLIGQSAHDMLKDFLGNGLLVPMRVNQNLYYGYKYQYQDNHDDLAGEDRNFIVPPGEVLPFITKQMVEFLALKKLSGYVHQKRPEYKIKAELDATVEKKKLSFSDVITKNGADDHKVLRELSKTHAIKFTEKNLSIAIGKKNIDDAAKCIEFLIENDFLNDFPSSLDKAQFFKIASQNIPVNMEFLLRTIQSPLKMHIAMSAFLYGSLKFNNKDKFLKLISLGVDINAPCVTNDCPLMVACLPKTDVDFTKMLISLGANVNQSNNLGITPLHVAARHGRLDCCQLLIDSGAKFTLDKKGNDVFSYATLSGKSELINFIEDEMNSENHLSATSGNSKMKPKI